MDLSNSGAPTMFGEVGLSTTQLAKDVATAKTQLQELAKEAKALGKLFDDLGVTNNLGNLKNGLESVSNNMKKVTNDIAQQFEKSAKKIQEARSKVVEAVSHNYKVGHISPEEAGQALREYAYSTKFQAGRNNTLQNNETEKLGAMQEKYKEMASTVDMSNKKQVTSLEKLSVKIKESQEKIMNYADEYEHFTSELVKAESALENIRRQVEKTEQAFNSKNVSKAKQAKAEETAFLNQADSEYKAKSKQMVDDLIQTRKAGNAKNEQEYKTHIQKLMADDNVLIADKKRLEVELNKVNEKIKSDDQALQQAIINDDKKTHTEKQKSLNELINNKRTALKDELDLEKARYKNGEINFIEYLNTLKRIERSGQGVFTQKDINGIYKERMGVDNQYANVQKQQQAQQQASVESLYNQRSKALADDLIQARKAGYVQDLGNHKANIEKLMSDERVSFNDRKQLAVELNNTHQLMLRKQLADEKAQDAQLRTLHDAQFGSAQQRFKSLTNYAFDASIIYGSIQGVKKMSETIKEVESASTNLTRVMPNATASVVKEVRQDAFDIGKEYGQQVGDVQKIQNLWARTHDEIANSHELLKSLSETTALGMEVGGFTSAEEAVKDLGSALQQLEIPWTEGKKVMDSWIKTADITAVGSAKDLADMISRVGSQAKQLNIDYNELNGITGIFANNMGRSGEEIGTAMRTVFSYFQDDSTIKTLSKYGVEVKKNAKEYNDFNDIMKQLHDTYKKLEADNNKTGIHEISNALGRIRRTDYVGVLMDNWNESQSIIDASIQSQGYAMSQHEKVVNTYEHKINQLSVAFQELSWSVGEAGLLDHLKGLVKGLTSAVDWFANLDPVMKSSILHILELSTALLLVTKTSQVLTGTGLVQMLAQMSARFAMLFQNTRLASVGQTILNGAMASGAKVVTANTIATVANASAQEVSNIVDAQGNAIATVATARTTANTIANNANTASQIALNEAKVVGAGASGVLGGALAGLTNPIGLVITALTIGVTAFVAYKQSQAEAIAESKRFIETQNELAVTLAKHVVQDSEIPALEEKYSKMDEINKKIQALAEKHKKQMGELVFDKKSPDSYYKSMTASARLDSEYNGELSKLNSQLKELGTNSDQVENDMIKLNSLMIASGDATKVYAYGIIDTIQARHDSSSKMREQVAIYDQLINRTNLSAQEEFKLKSVIDVLTRLYPTLANGRKINTQAILSQLGATGSLTNAQIEELNGVIQLSATQKSATISALEMDIAVTKAKKQSTLDRIGFMTQEAKAMTSLFGGMGFGQKKLSKQEITKIRADNPADFMLNDDAIQQRYGGGKDPAMQGLDIKLAELEATLKYVKGVKVFDKANVPDTYVPDDPAKAKAVKAEYDKSFLDFKKDELEVINSQLTVLKGKLDLLGDSDATRAERMVLVNQLRDKENEKLGVLNSTLGKYGTSLDDTNKKLSVYFKNWNSMSPEQKSNALDNASDATKQKVANLVKSYQDYSDGMRKFKEDTIQVQIEVKKYNDLLATMDIESKSAGFNRRINTDDALHKYHTGMMDYQKSVTQNEMSLLKPDDATGRLNKTLELLDQEKAKLEETRKARKAYNDELWSLNNTLTGYVSGWNKMTDEQRMVAINGLTDEQQKKLKPLIDLWNNLTTGMKDFNLQIGASEVNQDQLNQQAQSLLETEYRKNLEYEKQIANKRLLAKHQAEEESLQKRIFGMTEKAFNLDYETKVKAKQDEIDLLTKEAKLRDYNNKLLEIENELKKVYADTRFAYIDEKTGKEIYTYDRAKVADLLAQKTKEQQQKADDDKSTKLADELKSIQDQAEVKRKLYQTQLEDLQKWQAFETDSINEYWTQRLTDENVHNESLALVKQLGYGGALLKTKGFLKDNKGVYDSYQKPMYDTGKSLQDNLMNGLSSDADSWITKKYDEMFALGKTVAEGFQAGISAGGGLSTGGGYISPPISAGGGGSSGSSGGGGGITPPISAGSGGSSSGGGITYPIGFIGAPAPQKSSVESVRDQMVANGQAWNSATTTAQKDALHDANEKLGKSVGATYDSKTGVWKYPQYHVGGFVGGQSFNPVHEEIAKLLKGEFVMTAPMMDRLSTALALPNMKLNIPQPQASISATLPNGSITNIHINKIEANNFEDMMRSLDPYITSQG